MTGELWVAVAGIVAGALGNASGLLFAYWNSGSERRHADVLARAGRLHSQRLDVYAGISAAFERDKAFLFAAMVELESGQVLVPYPDRPSDREAYALLGRTVVTVSGETAEAIEAADAAVAAFSQDFVRAKQLAFDSEELQRLREQMHAKRDTSITAITAAQRALRAELESL